MLNRIPGINLALRGGSSGRGLGAGEGEVLINGQRTTGKNNEGRDQLNRITANQVDYIEIIRGTSENVDIRSGGQVVNVVLLESSSRSSTTIETETRRARNGTFDSGGQVSVAGTTRKTLITSLIFRQIPVTDTGIQTNLLTIVMTI